MAFILFLLFMVKLIFCQDDYVFFNLSLNGISNTPSKFVDKIPLKKNYTQKIYNSSYMEISGYLNKDYKFSQLADDSIPTVTIKNATDPNNHIDISISDECYNCDYLGYNIANVNKTATCRCSLVSPGVEVNRGDKVFDFLFKADKFVGYFNGFILKDNRLYYIDDWTEYDYRDISTLFEGQIDDSEFNQFEGVFSSSFDNYVLTFTDNYLYIFDISGSDPILIEKLNFNELHRGIPAYTKMEMHYDYSNSTIWIAFNSSSFTSLVRVDTQSLNVDYIDNVIYEGDIISLRNFQDIKFAKFQNVTTMYVIIKDKGLYIINLDKLDVTYYLEHCCLTQILPIIHEKTISSS
jgi:hypothetical protein